MIDRAYLRLMAGYNAEMNRRFYAAAAGLSEAQRTADAGAFWGSIHGTLSHLVWADEMWLSRFTGAPKPAAALKESGAYITDFEELRRRRMALDGDISAWADGLDDAWLAGDLAWFSGAAGREMKSPRATIVVHFFNHQTHHRGQVHALLTRAGAKTGDTDLWLVVPSGSL